MCASLHITNPQLERIFFKLVLNLLRNRIEKQKSEKLLSFYFANAFKIDENNVSSTDEH